MGCCGSNPEPPLADHPQTNYHSIAKHSHGEPLKYDPHFKGPKKSRSCTDIFCFLLFGAFLVAWGVVAWYAFSKGDIDRLLLPTDSQNRKCGLDSAVSDKPYLVFLDLTKCININTAFTGCPTTQICVKECPSENFLFDTAVNSMSIQELRTKMICDVDISQANEDDLKDHVANDVCARWYLKSTSILNRCVADVLPKICPNFKLSKSARLSRKLVFDQNDIRESILRLLDFTLSERDLKECPENRFGRFVPDYTKQNESNSKIILQMAQMIVEDVIDTKWYILYGLLIAMGVSLVFIAMMRWIAGPMVWLSIVGVLAMLSYGVYYSYARYADLKKYGDPNAPAPTNVFSSLKLLLAKEDTWLGILITLSVLLAIILLILIFLRKRIVIAIALVKEGSKVVSSTLSSVFFPIVPWVGQVLVIVFAVAVGLYLASIGDSEFKIIGVERDISCTCANQVFQLGSECDPAFVNENCAHSMIWRQSPQCENITCHFQGIKSPSFISYFHAWNVVGFFWAVCFVSAFGEMVLASTFATWYWTFHKSDVPFLNLTFAFLRTIRYHLGTLAFGSLIIAICRIIRCILEYIDQKLKKFDNPVTKAILCCMKCFFWMLENFLKFINRNAYIMCAIHGKNFCASAKDAFNLLMRNILRVVALDKVTDFLFFLSKVLISVGMGAVTYMMVESSKTDVQLHYNLVPVLLVGLGAYLIASIFFSVYSMAVDTLFLCFLEDSERNDGSIEKPFFMSKQLMRILGKKNEVPRHRYR